jgi:hypothetical protein
VVRAIQPPREWIRITQPYLVSVANAIRDSILNALIPLTSQSTTNHNKDDRDAHKEDGSEGEDAEIECSVGPQPRCVALLVGSPTFEKRRLSVQFKSFLREEGRGILFEHKHTHTPPLSLTHSHPIIIQSSLQSPE